MTTEFDNKKIIPQAFDSGTGANTTIERIKARLPSLDGKAGKFLKVSSTEEGCEWATGGGGSSDYTELSNKPKINSVELTGNKSLLNLGIIGTAGTGLSKSGDTLNHSNSIAEQTVQKLGALAYDAQGHITGFAEKSVVDNVTSIITDQPLSANQGKLLNDRINNLETIGRFLSLWNCATGLPTTNPATLPYTYKTGDYFIITVVDTTTNYKPNGATYGGTASSTTTSDAVATGDIWRYDGSTWSFESNHSSSSGVSDVQINSTSIVSAGVADFAVETVPVLGSVKLMTSGGLYQRIRYGTQAERLASTPNGGDVWIEIS